jgi:nucleoid-associated protein YgaU
MIFNGSRYAASQVIAPPSASGDSPRAIVAREIAPAAHVVLHVVTEGERLDHIAAKYYGDPTKYWLILDANLDVFNPFDLLTPGRQLRIPQNRIVAP